ncbi:MAG: putative O-glycosylation ligase, exosortase A system-associated, partial [Thermoanaerobaculia bacterium]
LGLLGLKYGLYSLMRGGGRITSGPGGFFPDNNGLALALCMGIPLVVGIGLTESRPILQKLSLVLALFSAAAVVFTFSRGGLLALIVAIVILVARSGKPIAVTVVVALSLAGLLVVTTEDFQQSYLERTSTIIQYQQDASAMGRIQEWGTAVKVFADFPMLGVGPDNLQLMRNFYVHDGSSFRTTHNSYLQILVACGLPGLILFVGALAFSIWRLEKLRRNSHIPWARIYASMLQCSLIAYSVGGMFGDGAYFDLTYHLIAMTVSLELAVEAENRKSEIRIQVDASASYEWWREAPVSGRPIS